MNIQPKESASSSAAYQPMGMMGTMSKMLAKKVNNQVMEKQSINIPIQRDFIEQNLSKMDVLVKDEDVTALWKENLPTCPKTIVTGKRTPFIKQKLIIGKETNLIGQGLMSEYKANLFVGCKDGSIRSIMFQPGAYKDAQKVLKWHPYPNHMIIQMVVCQGKMFTNSNGHELKIFDIDSWLQVGNESPECLFTIEGSLCFEIRQKGDYFKLVYATENSIQSMRISDEMDLKKQKSKPTKDIKPSVISTVGKDNGKILFLADQTKIVKQVGEDVTVLQERPSTQKIRGLFLEGQNLLSVSGDSLSQDTIVQLIDLTPPEPILIEEVKDEEENKNEENNQTQGSIKDNANSVNSTRVLSRLSNPSPRNSKPVTPRGSTSLKGKASLPQVQEELVVEDEEEPTGPKIETIALDGAIGDCCGVYKSHYLREGKVNYLIAGTKGIAVFDGTQFIFKIKTEFQVAMAIFSNDGKYIILIGEDGRFRNIQWTPLSSTIDYPLKEKDVSEVASSPDGKHFAILSCNQTAISIYRYVDMECICKFANLDNVFLMNFSANSKMFMMIYNDVMQEEKNEALAKQEHPDEKIVIDKTYMACIVPMDAKLDYKDPPFRIRLQDYPYQLDCCVSMRQLYTICKSESSNSSALYVFNFQQQAPARILKNIGAMTLSPDEKLLSYVDSSGTIFVNFIPKWEVVNEIKVLSAQNEMPLSLKFFQNQKIIMAQTLGVIYGINVYTHKIEFKIVHSSLRSEFVKVRVIFDEMVCFVDSTRKLCVYDISSKYPGSECRLQTDELEGVKVLVNKKYETKNNVAWAAIGNHLIMQLENTKQLLFAENPFIHQAFTMEDCLHSPFSLIDGFYIPVLMGGPILSTGSFAEVYLQALKTLQNGDSTEAAQTLQTPIYPFKLNALHYFAITHNVAGTEMCFKKRVRWINDIFGKSPLDYALQSGDRSSIEAVIKGLFETEYEDREAVMRELPLTILLKYSAVYLPQLLREAGSSVPDDSKYCGGASPPALFPLKKMRFGDSLNPIYDLQIKDALHPDSLLAKKGRNRAIATTVLNNPVPISYCDDSLELLSAIAECKSDEVVRSKPITLFLNRKWSSFAYNFYLCQFILFIILLLTLTFVDSFEQRWLFILQFVIAAVINFYFFLYECVQMAIQKLGYFHDPKNWLDLTRLTLMFMILVSKSGLNYSVPHELYPITFFLMWVKILSYFSVFKPTRYLIKMIFEIISDILTFLIILFTAIFAYAQINYSFQEAGDPAAVSFYDEMRIGYVMAYGELGEFMTPDYVKFFIFAVFSFFIPLVLLNMLIAIMSDSYARVQNNAVAADCRALAELELELEELVYFFYSTFKPQLIANRYYYCFQTQVNDGEDDEDSWEGTVGQLKNTINESAEELKAKIIESVNMQIKEKTNDVLDRLVKTNTETQNRIEQTQKLVEKESKGVQEQIEGNKKLINGAQDAIIESRTDFSKKHEQQEQLLHQVKGTVQQESTRIVEENEKKTKSVLKTIDETSEKEAKSLQEIDSVQKVMNDFANESQKKINSLINELQGRLEDLVKFSEAQEKREAEIGGSLTGLIKNIEVANEDNKKHHERFKNNAEHEKQQFDSIKQMVQEEAKKQDKGIKEELIRVQKSFDDKLAEVKTLQAKELEVINEHETNQKKSESVLGNILEGLAALSKQEQEKQQAAEASQKQLSLIAQSLEALKKSQDEMKLDMEGKLKSVSQELGKVKKAVESNE